MSDLGSVCHGLLAAAALLSTLGCGGEGAGPDAALDEFVGPAPNHNQVVGTYRGQAELADGRTMLVDIAARPEAFANGRFILDGVVDTWGGLEYDLRNGNLHMGDRFVANFSTYQVALHGAPAAAGWTDFEFLPEGSSTWQTVDVLLARDYEPLGGDNRVSIGSVSSDCNVTPTLPASLPVMGRMHLDYDVSNGPDGVFSAQMSLSEVDASRSMYLNISRLNPDDPEAPAVGHRLTFPAEFGQLNYSEPQVDGTIRQWTARSGAVVFDAVDRAAVSPSGAEDNRGIMTFHFEDIVMEPSNSFNDPRFVGAEGTFSLNYSGTATSSVRRVSAPL